MYDFERQRVVEQALVRFLGLIRSSENSKKRTMEFLTMWDAAREYEMAKRRAQQTPEPRREEPHPPGQEPKEQDDEAEEEEKKESA